MPKNLILHISFGLIFSFLLSLLFLGILDPEVSLISGFVSDYANGKYGLLFNLSVAIWGCGSLTSAWVFFQKRKEYKKVLISIILISIWGISSFFVASFPTDPSNTPQSLSGLIHLISASIAFISITLAALFLKRSDIKRPFDNYGLRHLLDFSIVAFLLIFQFGPMETKGLFERLLIFAIIIWQLELNIALRKS